MKLTTILKHITTQSLQGNLDTEISTLIIDSRKAEKGSMFFAIKGSSVDGHQFIENVIAQGAAAVVCEQMPNVLSPNVCYVQVNNVPEVMGKIAANFYNHPSEKLTLVGVTGTNGKTTIATLLFQLFTALGHHCGLISTVQNQIGDKIVPATHTTPDAISLQKLLAQMVEDGCEYAFMEVSSHAVHQHRIAGAVFAGGIFTNITHDHLDYHKTFDEYIKVKKKFFDDLPPAAFAITNIDDKRGGVMLQNTKANRKSYSLRTPADFKGKVIENGLEGLQMNVNGIDVHFRIMGLFNAYNLLAVYGAATMLHQDKMEVLAALSNLAGAKGRFETYRSSKEQILGIVDYAHTPDALLNVLATIKQFSTHQHIITVVGCGGDRDKTKRPEMAVVACEGSQKVILTSDNPRTENPEAILDDMEAGLNLTQKKKVVRISNRKEAIKTACMLAQKSDVILLAGKGHENYQEINGVKHHFDDKEILIEMYQLLEK